MNDAVVLDPALPAANRGLASLDALAAQTWLLEPPMPHEIPHLLRDEAALLLDGLLVRVARGRGALDLAVGEVLSRLAVGLRTVRIGFSGIGDYAYERLGIAPRTAQAMVQLARGLADRPLLREAVLAGEVGARKALVVLRVARGEAEAPWVARARGETVRALEAAVRAELGGGAPATVEPDEEDEAWERVCVQLPPGGRAKVDEALALAGRIIGPTSPRWQRLEALCQEYVAAFGVDGGELDPAAPVTEPVVEWLAEAKAALEEETRQWEFLASPAPVAAPDVGDTGGDPFHLDAELRRLAGMRARWDELLGHLAMLVKRTWLWRDMRFATFAHFCNERLGMSARTVEQRAWLARRLYDLPSLRQAMREGRLSYEKARLVASHADASNVDAWIARAEQLPCLALRRELDAADDTQMCAREALALPVPRRVRDLLSDAFRAARAAAGRWLHLGECLVHIAEHFLLTWKPLLQRRSTPSRRALARDGGLCQVPCCSRPAAHAHHRLFRSRGGGDELVNLVSTCPAHHLHGIHAGSIRVSGQAPDRLAWELGVRPGMAPLMRVLPGPRAEA